MDLMTITGNVLSGGLLGGITGLLGSAINAYQNYALTKLKNEHEIKMAEQTRLTIVAESEASVKIADRNLKIEELKTDAQSLESSYRMEEANLFDKSYMADTPQWFKIALGLIFGVIDAMRRAVRPSLTYYFVGVCTWVTWVSVALIQNHEQALIESGKAYMIFDIVLNMLIYLTVSCVTWWFADRQMSKYLRDKSV